MFLDVLFAKTLEKPCFLREILGSKGEVQGYIHTYIHTLQYITLHYITLHDIT